MAGFFGSIEKFEKVFAEKNKKSILKSLHDLDGIGETQINSIDSFFSNKINLKMNKGFN